MNNYINLIPLISAAQEKTTIAKIFWIVAGALFLITLIFGFFVAFVFTGDRDIKKIKENSDFNIRVYTYNYSNNTFYCFDMIDIAHNKTFNEAEFYRQFSKTDRHLVKNWLNAIASNDNHPEFIQADVVLSRFKRLACTMLEVTSINREKTIIHFNSHLLPNTYTSNMRAIAKAKNKLPIKFFISNIDEGQRYFNKTSLDSIGAAYYFKLYRNKPNVTPEEHQQLVEINNQLVLVLGRFLTRNRKLFKVNELETLFLDPDCISKIAALTQAGIIHTHIQQQLNQFNLEDVSVAVGVSNGTFYQRNFALAKEQSGKMADAIIKGLTTEKILFYDDSFFANYQLQKAQKDEVRMVIKNATFRNYFTPTLDLSNGQQSFYLLNTYPYGTKLKDFRSVLLLAKKMNNKVEDLYVSVISKCLRMIKEDDQPISIAVETPYSTVDDFIHADLQNPNTMINWILCIHETDILTSNDDPTQVAKRFHDYNRSGYRIAIIIENPSSNLRTRILRTISYFLVPPSFSEQNADINRQRSDLRNIQASYSSYRVPIVYYGLKKFSGIELAVHYGGKIFQCDELALPSSRIELLDQDKVDEIVEDTKNLGPRPTDNFSYLEK